MPAKKTPAKKPRTPKSLTVVTDVQKTDSGIQATVESIPLPEPVTLRSCGWSIRRCMYSVGLGIMMTIAANVGTFIWWASNVSTRISSLETQVSELRTTILDQPGHSVVKQASAPFAQ